MASVDGLAARVLDVLGFAAVPPVDVERVAQRLGISEIVDEELVEDGRLECVNGEHRILLRRGLKGTRRRFTVGHELGHLLLSEGTSGVVARRALPVTGDVERFCDSFAAALLLPRAWILDRYARRAKNLSTVRQLSMQTRTSMAASVVRLGDVLGWRHSLLRWKREGGKWRFLAGAAVPSRLHGHLGSADGTSEALDEIKERTGRDALARLPVRLLDQEVSLEAQISVKGGTAMVLVELPREVSGHA